MKNKLDKNKIKYSIKRVLIILLISIIFLHLNYKFSFSIPCLFHKITHLYCPGCGITRMILSLLKMEFYQAFRYNPLIFIMLPIITYLELKKYLYWIQNKNYKISNKVWYVLLFITIVFTILRNTEKYSFLIPTKI